MRSVIPSNKRGDSFKYHTTVVINIFFLFIDTKRLEEFQTSHICVIKRTWKHLNAVEKTL